MQFGSEVLRVTDDDNPPAWIMSKQPGHERDRDADRLQRAWRLVDVEPPIFTGMNLHQTIDDGVDVPVVLVAFAGTNGQEDPLNKVTQIGSKQRCQDALHLTSPSSSAKQDRAHRSDVHVGRESPARMPPKSLHPRRTNGRSRSRGDHY